MEDYRGFKQAIENKMERVDDRLKRHDETLEKISDKIECFTTDISDLKTSDIVQNNLLKTVVEELRGLRTDLKRIFLSAFVGMAGFMVWYIQRLGGF